MTATQPDERRIITRVAETALAAVIASAATTYTMSVRHDERLGALERQITIHNEYQREALAALRADIAALRAGNGAPK